MLLAEELKLTANIFPTVISRIFRITAFSVELFWFAL